MSSRKTQAAPATDAKNKSVLAAGGVTSGITTRSKARAISAASSTPASTLPKEPAHPKYEPVITLVSLSARREESPRRYSESLLSDADSSSSSAMQVMTTGATSIEEQLAQMNEAIARLTRTVEEKDLQIAALVNRLEEQDGDKPNPKVDPPKNENDEEEDPPVEKDEEKPEPDQAAALMGSLSIKQLQEMIASTVKAQYEESSHTSMLYSKPYSKKIDALKMPRGYQPPKFMQFDGKGNPKQHVAHFVETCNNAGTEGNYLAKQFVRSLKGNAFEWYTDLEPESINSWEQLEREFLNRFYSTRRTVSMLELTSTKQWRDEPVMDYINRWRNLSLDCKDRLSEISSIEMCIQGMQWGLQYILQGIKPRTFEELATRAHDMELSIAHHGKKEPITDFKRDKVFTPKADNHGKKPAKEAFTTNTTPIKTSSAPVKISSNNKANEIKRSEPSRTQDRYRNTLRELEQKVYPFPDSDMDAMLDDLLEKKVIELPECKRPEEMNRVNDPKYCKYHRIVGHHVGKCFILKELIMKLAQQGRIELDLENTAATHTTTIVFGSFDPVPLQEIPDHARKYSNHTTPSVQPSLGASNQATPTDDDEGWTLVTTKKTRKPRLQAAKPKVKQERKHRRRNNRKPKASVKAVRPTYAGESIEQKPRIPVSLHEYFPKDFFQQCNIVACHMVDVEIEGSLKDKAIAAEEEKTSAPEEDLPTYISIKEALLLPEEIREALAAILVSPDSQEAQESKGEGSKSQPREYTACCAACDAIHFTDEDLLLGSKPHNRPLFVSGYVREIKVNRMLVDGGSAINIMPKSTMTTIGIKVDELSRSRLLIQGFNQGGQRAMGMIRVEMTIGELKTSTLFHVIDAKTSYSLLLGRPWIHENGVIPSTLHQCLKFYQEGVKVIQGDTKPFTEAESHFADAKFYTDEDMVLEALPEEIRSTGRAAPKRQEWQAMPKKQERQAVPSSSKNDDEPAKLATTKRSMTPSKGPNAPIFRYIPMSRRKNGESPFETRASKIDTQLQKDNTKLLKASAALPLTQLGDIRVARPPQGFIKALPKGAEPSFLPTNRTEEGFDPNAYKLMSKAGYNFTSSANLGKKVLNTVKDNERDLTETQKKLKEHGYGVNNNKAGLGFTPNAPVKISSKAKNASAQHISVIIVQDKEEPQLAPQTSIFDRMNHSRPRVSALKRVGSQTRTSVFKRLNTSASRSSVFKRLSKPKKQSNMASFPPRPSVMERLREAKEPSKRRKTTPEIEKIDSLAEKDDVRSSIPSKMKRQAILEVNTVGSLKVKRRTIIHTGQSSCQQAREVNTKEEAQDVFHITIHEGEEDEILEEDVIAAPSQLEDGGQATVDDLKELNLGTREEPKPIFVSALLSADEIEEYYQLLLEYKDVFAWTYKEMPGLDPIIAVHHLAVKPGTRPIKQTQRRYRSELIPQIEAEIDKLIEAGFIREVQYPKWISNIVIVLKKSGQIRVCVDFRDLNDACPKDDFPLPIIEIMVDATTGHEALSFMDGSSGYNQIRMALEDEELTAFRTPKGIYCYKVMPFGLKNAGATYQRAMQKIFNDMLHKNVECYVDDVVVKTKKRSDHLKDLRIVFERLRKYNLKMNPLKCAFGVTSGKFLGFIVKHRGIEVDQSKIKAIQSMPEPRNLHELKSLQGRLAFIRRFISNLAGRCQPFSRLMKKDVPFVWDKACHNAFESIKKYLSSPPVLGAPVPGKPLILYIAAQESSVGALLAQKNEFQKEEALYYLSRTLTGAELNYSPIEKMCLALVFAIQKLRHYMHAYTIHLVAKADPVRYVMSKPVLTGRLAKWALLLNQYEIVYVPAKAIKGQALADFLADHPIPADWKISDDLPDEEVFYIDVVPAWTMFFDGSARADGAGAGVVFMTPQRHILPYSFQLTELCSNNVAEYQALIIGLQMAINMEITALEIYGDSKLIINQLLTEYEVRKDDLVPYFRLATQLLQKFEAVTLEHVPRKENQMADALANLASSMTLGKDEAADVPVCQRWVIPLVTEILLADTNVISVLPVDTEEWRQPLINYLEHGILPDDPKHRSEVRRRAHRFLYYKGTLYRRSFEGVLLRCLGDEEANQAMEEAHSGICGAHQSGPKLHFQLKRMGYYWPSMVKDCLEHAKRCQACQFHANFIHQPPEPLHPTAASWPFDAWGLDVVGPIAPKSSAGEAYILAATDYFSKWAEAIPLKEVKKETVVRFIKEHIIHRYGVPRYIVTDNGKQFSNRLVDELCEKYKFRQHKSSMYHAPANGLAEAFNKTLCNLLKKVIGRTKKDWHERIGEALWAYRTTYRTPTQATPYSLVYGVEAVLPLESQIPSLRMAIQEGLTDEENAKLRLQELEALDEKRLEAQQHLECYQARLSKAFNKKVRPRSFQMGDLVLSLRRPIITTHKTKSKFTSKWDGPYVIQEVYTNGAYLIMSGDGLKIGPINGRFLKRYYP